MPYLLLAGLAILLLLLLLKNLGQIESHFLGQVIRWTAFLIFLIGISILLLTGRVAYAGGVLLLFALLFGPQLKSWFKKIFRIRESLPPKMSKKEALEVLGLAQGASNKDVLEAYRRLIAKNHPDHGGSAYMASKLNEAKEVLLENPKVKDSSKD